MCTCVPMQNSQSHTQTNSTHRLPNSCTRDSSQYPDKDTPKASEIKEIDFHMSYYIGFNDIKALS